MQTKLLAKLSWQDQARKDGWSADLIAKMAKIRSRDCGGIKTACDRYRAIDQAKIANKVSRDR
jgi:hypothetical protein